jgi:hypothetical protein
MIDEYMKNCDYWFIRKCGQTISISHLPPLHIFHFEDHCLNMTIDQKELLWDSFYGGWSRWIAMNVEATLGMMIQMVLMA